MQAIILVGGEGTRLRPLTYGTPKPMVPLFGIPFLKRALVRLRDAGVTETVLAAGYLPHAIESHFGDGSRIGMKLTYVVESSPLGTAGALRNVAGHIRGPFFVLNGDVLTSLDLRAMRAFHALRGGAGVIHAIRVEDPSAFGCVVSDADGRVTAFVEKPAPGEAPTDQINAGTYLLERSVLDAIPAGRSVSIERETFPQLLAAGKRLYSYVTSDYWLDLGRPEQYLQAHYDVLRGNLDLGEDAGAADGGTYWLVGAQSIPPGVHPPVYLGANVGIDPTATVGPHCIVGDGSQIEARAVVRDAVLWDDVVVEADATVEDAILASRVRIGSGATVGPGAVIGHDARVAAGTVTEPGARIRSEEEPLSAASP